MRSPYLRFTFLLFLGLAVSLLGLASMADAGTSLQAEDDQEALIEYGRYLTTIAGCHSCHTPFKEEYADLTKLTTEELVVFALNENLALDEERPFAGGRVFDLGPAGVILTRNLTPDPVTGIGNWTDDQIKDAVRLGVTPTGRQLFPLMPYLVFNHMAESDLDAIIAYLRSLEPIENDIPVVDFGIPPMELTLPDPPVEAPDPADTEARGQYLMSGVLSCTDCHTPLDPETGLPELENYLAGGQPFEGPWGIVYGGNITPDKETGLGEWSDTEIFRVLSAGVRPDGRRLVLMPWQIYGELTPEDASAVVYFLQNDLEPVEREVPAAALAPEFIEFVELSQ